MVITIEREPGAPTIAAYSDDPNITVVRDADVTDRELLIAFAEVLEDVTTVTA
jgi:hypothetical protein